MSPLSYSMVPPYRGDGGLWLKSVDLERSLPKGRARIPGYFDRVTDVRTGRIPPFWGPEHRLLGGPIADLVRTIEHQDAASDPLRDLLEEAGVEGLDFYPIVVDGTTPMSLMAVRGVAELDWASEGMRLVDGAEVGLYAEANLFVSPRIADLVRAAGLDLTLRPSEIPLDVRKGWSKQT